MRCAKLRSQHSQKAGWLCRNIKRFQHYQRRWEAHAASKKLEDGLRARAATTIAGLEATQTSHLDHAWLTQVPCRFSCHVSAHID